jgi:hypothetical protein
VVDNIELSGWLAVYSLHSRRVECFVVGRVVDGSRPEFYISAFVSINFVCIHFFIAKPLSLLILYIEGERFIASSLHGLASGVECRLPV